MEQGLRYYIRNHIDAERDTRGFRRAIISYNDLLANWRLTIAKAAKALAIPLRPTPDQVKKVDSFLERDMHHLKLAPDEYPDNNLRQIAFGIHSAYQRLALGGAEVQVRRDLDQLSMRFDSLPAPECC